MNNEAPKFDPITGQLINSTNNQENTNLNTQNNETNNGAVNNETNNGPVNMQSIATIDQSNEQFINNVQSNSEIQNKPKQEKTSYLFLIVLFLIIFAAIFFLFPMLNK